MARFFVPTENISENAILINGSDVNHIKNVLRHTVGDRILISDSSGMEYDCVISDISDREIMLEIKSSNKCDTELGLEVVLFQGMPKKDKMELIIQKAVELGVTKIVPVMNERTVVKFDDKKAAQKTERWNKISEAAAKQSGRMIIPEVHEPVSYNVALKLAENLEYLLMPYENAEGMNYSSKCINEAVKSGSLGIFIGPEGGFSNNEAEQAKKSGAKIISLGKRILRTETAGIAVLSIIMFEKERLEA